MKVAVIQAGGGAAGKSTTTRAFVLGDPEEHQDKAIVPTRHGPAEVKCNWTLYANCGVAGNHSTGTDSNIGPGPTDYAFRKCLEHRDVAVVDGMVSSPKWSIMCREAEVDHVLLVYYKLQPETLLERLAKRRGVDKESIREKMWDKCVGLTRRAELLYEHLHNKDLIGNIPVTVIEVYEHHSPDDIVDMLDSKLFELLGEAYPVEFEV